MTNLSTLLRLPLLVTQGLWVAARATRLPEAEGPRRGQAGQGTPLRLLILGDSSAAGVGVDHQDKALAGRLVARMASTHAVHWHLWARSGLTTAGALRLLESQQSQRFDVAVLALGVNDVKNGMTIARWQANYQRLISILNDRFGARCMYASGVPPLGAFPLLPDPLRGVLGARATRFDAALSDLCAHTENAQHLPFDISLDPKLMAADGFHPSGALYDIWAGQIAAALEETGLTLPNT